MTAPQPQELGEFFDEYVYPAEAAFATRGGTSQPWSPVLDEVRKAAQRRGWWNLFSSVHPAHHSLDPIRLAELAEIVGRSPVLGQVALHSLNPDAAAIELLAALGSERQRERWLPALVAGEITSAYCMSEPGVASSDPRALRVRGERLMDGSIQVDGVKSWCTGATTPSCQLFIVLVLSEPDANPASRYSLVVVERSDSGVAVAREHTVLGFSDAFRGGHPDVVFTAAAGELLGEAGAGLTLAQRVLGPARMLHCMRLVGTAERALDLMTARLAARKVRGRSLADNDLWIDRIGAARISVESVRALVRSMATRPGSAVAESIVKAEVPARVTQIVDLAIQAHGADGLSAPGILPDLYAHARSLRISDGPDEVHRRVVGRHELAHARSAGH